MSLSLRRAWIEILFPVAFHTWESRSPYGERGLKSHGQGAGIRRTSRSPYGERGLKYRLQYAKHCTSSRSPYGERGLKLNVSQAQDTQACRSPYGERGLKYFAERVNRNVIVWSLSLRRAWIEIGSGFGVLSSAVSRSPYGERGLKYLLADAGSICAGRSPYGERGLKLCGGLDKQRRHSSLSLRRAWIEMSCCSTLSKSVTSLSLRRAWIEIHIGVYVRFGPVVALLTESVD